MAGDVKVDVGSVVTGLGSIINNFRGKIPVELQGELEKKAMEIDAAVMASQANINAEEAKSTSFFIAGARPLLLWACGIAFIFNTFIRTCLLWIDPSMNLPQMDSTQLDALLYGLLGLAGARTIEKLKNAQNNH